MTVPGRLGDRRRPGSRLGCEVKPRSTAQRPLDLVGSGDDVGGVETTRLAGGPTDRAGAGDGADDATLHHHGGADGAPGLVTPTGEGRAGRFHQRTAPFPGLLAVAPFGQNAGMKLRIFTEPQQGATYDTLLAAALVAEEEGFDAFFRSDHYLKMGAVDGRPGPTDAWITLAGLARDTSTIRLGTMVTSATFRLPGPLAIAVAEVDAMSGGRVELGLGAGWYEDEHRAYGIPFPATAERFARLEEQLAIITGLWDTREGETFDFSGAHYQVGASPALPKPVQQPHPPVIIGGGGPKRTPRLAATYADEFNAPFMLPDATRAQFARVAEACEAVDRDPATLRRSAALIVCCGEDDDAVARRAKAIGREVDELKRNGVCGTPAEVSARLHAYGEAGVEVAYLQILDLSDLDHLRLVAREVAPGLV
jgi:F420-dependent oxidoreductase-like protein